MRLLDKIMGFRLMEEGDTAGGNEENNNENNNNENNESPPELSMEQFRTVVAGDNQDVLKRLERYADPAAVGTALMEAQNRIREGFKPEAFPEDGTDEEKAAWREQNGIPKTADDYLANIGEGIVIGDADKPIYESLAGALHEQNLPQTAIDTVAQWYDTWRQEAQTAKHETDQEHLNEVDDLLASEYGPAEYRANKNNLMNVLKSSMPEEAADALLNGRLSDGRAFFNNADVVRGLIKMARQVSPINTLVSAGNDPGKAIDDRLDEIREIRRKDYDAYMKDDKLLKEERELLDQKQKLEAA